MSSQSSNGEVLSLKQRIADLEAESEQKGVRYEQLVVQVSGLQRSQEQLLEQFVRYREEVREQAGQLQQEVEERNGCIGGLRSEVKLLQQSNMNLYKLLRASNKKIVELMKELTEKNRFIKEYIQDQDSRP